LRNTAGIAARIFTEVRDTNIRMISQGASEINITFVIEEDAVPKVVKQLHKKFFTDVDPETFA
jgi:aspartate kinase